MGLNKATLRGRETWAQWKIFQQVLLMYFLQILTSSTENPDSRTAPRRAAWTFSLLSNLNPHFPWYDRFYFGFPVLQVFRDYRVEYEVHDLSLHSNAFIIDYTRCIHLKALQLKKINGYVKIINSLVVKIYQRFSFWKHIFETYSQEILLCS